MYFIIAAFLAALGWYAARLIYEVASELIFCRLHKAKWYQVAAGKEPKEINKPGDAKAVKNQIGFHYTEKD